MVKEEPKVMSKTDLQQIKDHLSKEVENLEIQKSNLEDSIARQKIRIEQEKTLAKHDAGKEFTKRKEELVKLSNEISARENQVELKEMRYKERLEVLEKREAELGIINKHREDLYNERLNFAQYKKKEEEKLQKANLIIAEAKAQENKLRLKLDQIKAQEKNLSLKARRLDEWEGILIQKQKNLEYSRNEVVNV